jgi:hypothetical protein
MNQSTIELRGAYAQIQQIQGKLFPPHFNTHKKDLIDYAFLYRPQSFADLGGIWGVDGVYTFYALDRYDVSTAYLFDTDHTEAFTRRAACYPQLRPCKGNFGDFDFVKSHMPSVDAVFLFDVLFHQVKPDWDEILAFYAQHCRIFVIHNSQFMASEKTVRLLDLGEESYFANVPHVRTESPYKELFEKMYEVHPQHNRIWRDIHNVWQWGITDQDLIDTAKKLGFTLCYFINCGRWGNLKNFESHGFVFVKV